jgi:hypothetical protein
MPITFGTKGNSYLCSQITGGVENAVPLHTDIPFTGRRGFDLPFIIVSLKTQVPQSFLRIKHTRHQLALDGAGLHGLGVDSVNSRSDYFEHLSIPASKTMRHRKRMSIVD